MKEKVKWMSAVTVCDLCGKPFGKYFIDGKTILGPWALMCETCHTTFGYGLGIGNGQKYDTKTKVKVGG